MIVSVLSILVYCGFVYWLAGVLSSNLYPSKGRGVILLIVIVASIIFSLLFGFVLMGITGDYLRGLSTVGPGIFASILFSPIAVHFAVKDKIKSDEYWRNATKKSSCLS